LKPLRLCEETAMPNRIFVAPQTRRHAGPGRLTAVAIDIEVHEDEFGYWRKYERQGKGRR
jgi:hypothetical protein